MLSVNFYKCWASPKLPKNINLAPRDLKGWTGVAAQPLYRLNPTIMADAFTQIYIHLIFCPKHREALILADWEEKLHRYITGIVEGRGHKLLAIGGMPDHIHIFIGQKVSESIPDLVKEIKNASNDFVKKEKLSRFKFDWQSGYGAFSHSRSQIDAVCRYVLNQKEHHRKKTFKAEFLKLCEDFGVEAGRKEYFDW